HLAPKHKTKTPRATLLRKAEINTLLLHKESTPEFYILYNFPTDKCCTSIYITSYSINHNHPSSNLLSNTRPLTDLFSRALRISFSRLSCCNQAWVPRQEKYNIRPR